MLITSCSNKKYTNKDGEKIFSSNIELQVAPHLELEFVAPPETIDNICMLVTDFDYKNANLSMNSYPKIDALQYKKYFSRNGDLDFYLHPIICHGMVYDIDKNAKITAFELKDKKVKKIWSEKILSFGERKNSILANARLEEEKSLYISTSNGYVVLFDVVKKKIIWKKHYNGAMFTASPTIYDNNIYLISSDDSVYAINKNTGDVQWKTEQRDDKNIITSFQIPPVVIHDGKVIVGLSNGNILVLNAKNGNTIWENKISSVKTTNVSNITDIDFPPIVVDGILIAGGIKTSIVGFNFKTGQPIWQIPTGLNSYMLYNNSGFVFFVNEENNNICFSVRNGQIKWIRKSNSNVKASTVPRYLNNGNTLNTVFLNRFFDSY